MNFFPIENQILLKRRYRQKVLIFFGFIIFSLIFINLILIAPSYFFLKISGENLKKQSEIINQSPVFLRFAEIENSFKNLNLDIIFLENRGKEIRFLAPLLEKIINEKLKKAAADISVNFISFALGNENAYKQADKIIIQGNAKTRIDLLKFVKNLEKEGGFLEIQSPPSNLLKEKDIDYTLNIFTNEPR